MKETRLSMLEPALITGNRAALGAGTTLLLGGSPAACSLPVDCCEIVR
jgi:hypothetical protein